MIIWGGVPPALLITFLLLALVETRLVYLAMLIPALYLAQWLRLSRAERRVMPNLELAAKAGALRVLHQFAALSGLLSYWRGRLLGKERGLIEYK